MPGPAASATIIGTIEAVTTGRWTTAMRNALSDFRLAVPGSRTLATRQRIVHQLQLRSDGSQLVLTTVLMPRSTQDLLERSRVCDPIGTR